MLAILPITYELRTYVADYIIIADCILHLCIAAMAARPDPLPRLSVANDMELTVLDLGVEFSYTIPSFSVFSVKLRQCTVQFEARDARVLVYDCFIRSDPFLDTVTPPFCVKLTRHCFVPVSLLNVII